MSTSLLYHGLGVRDYRYVKTEYVRGGVVFAIERRRDTCRRAAIAFAKPRRKHVEQIAMTIAGSSASRSLKPERAERIARPTPECW